MFRRTQDPLWRERSFNYRVFTFSDGPFQTTSSTPFLCNSMLSVLQPQEASLLVWAMSRFARRYSGNRVCFLFLRVLRCFSSPGSPPYTMYSCMDTWTLLQAGFPIRKSLDQRLLAPPQSLSQLTTSFIGSQRQGIHPTLFHT